MLKIQFFKFAEVENKINQAAIVPTKEVCKYVAEHAIEHAFFTNIIKIKKNIEAIHRLIQQQFPSEKVAILQQTHSNICHIIEETEKTDLNLIVKIGDALVTRQESIALGIITADCIPLLFIDKINKAIGVAHAGWRGAKSGIIEQTIKSMKKIGSSESNIEVIIGPSIKQMHYEVSEEFYEDFLKDNRENKQFFIKKVENEKKFFFDLTSYAKTRLKNFHIKESNIYDLGIDTYSNTAIASYRRFQKDNSPDNSRNIALLKIQPIIAAAKPLLPIFPLQQKLSAISLKPAGIFKEIPDNNEQQQKQQDSLQEFFKEKEGPDPSGKEHKDWLTYTKSLSKLITNKKISKEKFFPGADALIKEKPMISSPFKKTVEEKNFFPLALDALKEPDNYKSNKRVYNANQGETNNKPPIYKLQASQQAADSFLLKPHKNEPELAKLLKKLQKGIIFIENKLDLHGFNLEQAYINIKDFILENYTQRKRYLLVIVGKGRNNQGLIRANIRNWIEADHILSPKILFINEALPAHGGDGSLYIFLRRQRRNDNFP